MKCPNCSNRMVPRVVGASIRIPIDMRVSSERERQRIIDDEHKRLSTFSANEKHTIMACKGCVNACNPAKAG